MVLTIAAIALPVIPLFPQTASFEVASIKPTKLPGGVRAGCHGTDSRFGPNDPNAGVPLGRCVVSSGRLSHLLALAYGITTDTIIGPDWVMKGRDLFDLEAKVEDPRSATETQLLSMLQGLVIERFQLKFHRETREVTRAVLTVTGKGPKLRPATSDEERSTVFGGPLARRMTAAPSTAKTRELPVNTLVVKKADMSGVTNLLTAILMAGTGDEKRSDEKRSLDGRIINMTGLDGNYDFELEWEPDESLYKAVQDQLGLKIESRKVPTEYFVIDHADKPTTN
jgi:uncharacterized protein (TIGR03435 family)